jgi:hypothetical protein
MKRHQFTATKGPVGTLGNTNGTPIKTTDATREAVAAAFKL